MFGAEVREIGRRANPRSRRTAVHRGVVPVELGEAVVLVEVRLGDGHVVHGIVKDNHPGGRVVGKNDRGPKKFVELGKRRRGDGGVIGLTVRRGAAASARRGRALEQGDGVVSDRVSGNDRGDGNQA